MLGYQSCSIAGQRTEGFFPVSSISSAANDLEDRQAKGDSEQRYTAHRIATRLLADLAPLDSEWSGLLSLAPAYSYCQTRDYCVTAAAHAIRAGGTVHLLTVRDGSALVGLWALGVRREGFVRVLCPLGCGNEEEYASPLVSDDGAAAITALLLAEAYKIRADIFRAPKARSDSVFVTVLAESAFARHPSRTDSINGYDVPLREFPTWDSYIAQLPRQMRSDLRTELKRLEGVIEFGWCRTPEEAGPVLDWLFQMKRQWSRDRGYYTPYLEKGLVHRFFLDLADDVLARGADWPLVSFMKLDGRPIAGAISFAGGASFEGFISAYDPAFHLYAPGKHLLHFLIRYAYEHRQDFDFRILDATYKKRWSAQEAAFVSQTIMLTRRARLADLQAFSHRILPAIRRRLKKYWK